MVPPGWADSGRYLHIGDHQVPGEPGPAVNEAVPVQQVHSAKGGGASAEQAGEIRGPSTQLYPQVLGCLGVLNSSHISKKTVPELSLHELP